jgi:hypothetical protein
MTRFTPEVLANTQAKLDRLESRYAAAQQEPASDPHARELSLRSLKRLINQLREEITLASIRSRNS